MIAKSNPTDQRAMSSMSSALLVASLLLCLSACARPPAAGPKEETPAAAELPKPEEPTPNVAAPPPPPATPEEARQTLARVYGNVVSLEPGRPNFVVGDFNGDGSQDIALVVRPDKAKLADINSEVASWIIRDALTSAAPRSKMERDPNAPPIRPTVGEKDELLLAVIHGHGARGWRDEQAQQTYLIRNAIGQGLETITKKSLMARKNEKKPPLIGDVIGETRAGASGYIYYTGSAYGWFDPRTYPDERPLKRAAH